MKTWLLIGCFMLGSPSAFADKTQPSNEPLPAIGSIKPIEGNAHALSLVGLVMSAL
jgi:hypothetical protein